MVSPKRLSVKVLSTYELMQKFPDEQAAIDYLAGILWPDGPDCPFCGGKRVKVRKSVKNFYNCADSIHRQFEDGRFDCGLAGRIRVFGIKCLVRTCRVFADISLFAIVQSVFSYLFASAERAFEDNQSHYVSSLKLLDKPDRTEYIDFRSKCQCNNSST